jgi:hypothetical protein
MLFGPTELRQSVAKSGERESNDVVITAFDARDVPSGAALNRIGAGFVERLSAGEIPDNFVRFKRGEMNMRCLAELDPFGVG